MRLPLQNNCALAHMRLRPCAGRPTRQLADTCTDLRAVVLVGLIWAALVGAAAQTQSPTVDLFNGKCNYSSAANVDEPQRGISVCDLPDATCQHHQLLGKGRNTSLGSKIRYMRGECKLPHRYERRGWIEGMDHHCRSDGNDGRSLQRFTYPLG